MKYGERAYWMYSLALLLLVGMLYYWTGQITFLYGIGVLLLLLLIPTTGIFLTRSWKIITHFIGKVNGLILLSVIFFVIVLPVGFLRRILGKDELRIRKNVQRESYFEVAGDVFDLEGAERPW